MATLSKQELEALDMQRICKELSPREERLLEAYKAVYEETEAERLSDIISDLRDFNHALQKEVLELQNKIKGGL